MTSGKLQAIVRRVHRRALQWLCRRGYMGDRPLERRSDEPPEQGAMEACAAIAMQRGAFVKLVAEDDTQTAALRGEDARLRRAVKAS